MSRSNLLRQFGFLAGLFATAGCIPAGQNSAVEAFGAPGTVFPSVVGINLEGNELALPEHFKGIRNLVAVAFERDQQTFVDTWIAAADELTTEIPGFQFYEVPTIFEANPVFRMWVNNGMRSGIPDPVARQRTVTVYVDRERFTELLAITDMSEIHVFLLDSAGRVLWRTKGAAEEQKLELLRNALSTEIST